jgi:drug/metabolite transporter (DMT)-like permease
MCAAMALFIVNDALVKIALVEMPTHQIIFVRGLIASTLILVVAVVTGAHRQWRALAHPLIVTRTLLEAFVAYTYIAALGLLTVADATAINMLSPLLITALGALFLGEDVRWRRWAAIGAGFAGMLLVVRPGGGVFGVGALLALAATFAVAVRDVITRRLPTGVPTVLVTASTLLVLTTLTGIASLILPTAPVRGPTLALLAVAAVLVVLGNIAIIVAFRDTDVSAVSPFRYTVIVWAVIVGYLVFGDLPQGLTWVGIGLIVGSGLYSIYRETVAARERRAIRAAG